MSLTRRVAVATSIPLETATFSRNLRTFCADIYATPGPDLRKCSGRQPAPPGLDSARKPSHEAREFARIAQGRAVPEEDQPRLERGQPPGRAAVLEGGGGGEHGRA